MAHVRVALRAEEHVATGLHREHLVHEVTVAIETRVLSNAAVARLDLNGFVEIFESEGKRMEEAVVSLGHPLPGKVVREMAVVAESDVRMAAVLPGIILRLHDVAIHTGFGIVAEITVTLAIAKREGTHTAKHAEQNCDRERKPANPRDQPSQAFTSRASR